MSPATVIGVSVSGSSAVAVLVAEAVTSTAAEALALAASAVPAVLLIRTRTPRKRRPLGPSNFYPVSTIIIRRFSRWRLPVKPIPPEIRAKTCAAPLTRAAPYHPAWLHIFLASAFLFVYHCYLNGNKIDLPLPSHLYVPAR